MLSEGSCLTALSIILQLREKASELRLQRQTQISRCSGVWGDGWRLGAFSYLCLAIGKALSWVARLDRKEQVSLYRLAYGRLPPSG